MQNSKKTHFAVNTVAVMVTLPINAKLFIVRISTKRAISDIFFFTHQKIDCDSYLYQ